MKKLFFSAILLAFVATLNAQKNTLLVGGNIGIDTSKTEAGSAEVKTNNFEFNPFVGYQFNDHWTLGIESAISSSKQENNGTDEVDLSGFSLGAFGRYTQPINNTFAVFGQLSAGYQNQSDDINDLDGNGFYAQFFPALFINFKNSFGLNFNIGGIRYDNLSFDGDVDVNRFNLNFGQSVNIGISKNFGLGSKK